MPRLPWKPLAFRLFAGFLLTIFWLPFQQAGAEPARLQQPYVEPFLYPPFPGAASEEAIFDHSNPNYSQTDNRIVAFTGDQGDKFCPAQPSGGAAPQAGICDGGSGIYWSTSLGDWLSYNGHDGIDFGMQYRPVLAAADTDQVLYAGWQDPMDHRYALGLAIKLHHANGYTTVYGHLSAVAVPSCALPGCTDLHHGDPIGYSGSTGNSAGPHLHFGVANPANKSIDPYGWTGENADPWPYDQSNSLWVQLPSVVPYYGSRVTVLPGGDPLPLPSAPTSSLVVDDSGPGFTSLPASCWSVATTAANQSENGSMRYLQPVVGAESTCTARWDLPPGQPAGTYGVYVHIPGVHSLSEGALYIIFHAGRTAYVTVNQAVFPNPYYVPDGWVFIGSYGFNGLGNEFVSLSNMTLDTASTYQNRELGVDAVRFSYLSGSLPTVTPTVTHTPSRTPTPSRTASASPTSTPSRTASASKTISPSRTPTPTRSLTASRTGSRTPTGSRTSTATRTRTPTRTPTASRTGSRTPTRSRTPISSRTRTPTRTLTATRTVVVTPTPTLSRTPTSTLTPRDTHWPTATPSPTYVGRVDPDRLAARMEFTGRHLNIKLRSTRPALGPPEPILKGIRR